GHGGQGGCGGRGAAHRGGARRPRCRDLRDQGRLAPRVGCPGSPPRGSPVPSCRRTALLLLRRFPSISPPRWFSRVFLSRGVPASRPSAHSCPTPSPPP